MSHRTRLCALCRRPLAVDTPAHACPACVMETRALLAAIAAELPQLQESLVPGAAPAGGRSSGRAHAPLPLRLDALNLLGPGGIVTPWTDTAGDQVAGIPLVSMLRWWADYIGVTHFAVWRREGEQYVGPCRGALTHGRGAAAWCRWLDAYLEVAADHRMIRQLHDDLAEALDAVLQVTRTQPQRRRRLAPCPACDAVAMVAVDGRWDVVCEACGHHMEPAAYAAHAAAVLPVLHDEVADAMAALRPAAPAVPQRPARRAACPRCSAAVTVEADADRPSACEACGSLIQAGPDAATLHATTVLLALTLVVAE